MLQAGVVGAGATVGGEGIMGDVGGRANKKEVILVGHGELFAIVIR